VLGLFMCVCGGVVRDRDMLKQVQRCTHYVFQIMDVFTLGVANAASMNLLSESALS
jgi:hypothetical protein